MARPLCATARRVAETTSTPFRHHVAPYRSGRVLASMPWMCSLLQLGSAAPSIARCSTTASTSTPALAAAGDTGSRGTATDVPARVKVGYGGVYLPFEHENVLDMDSSDLLTAVARDARFGPALDNVPLDCCDVMVTSSSSSGEVEPSVSEEAMAAAQRLRGAKTVRQHLSAQGAAAGAPIFIQIELPGAVFDRESSTAEQVYAALAPKAKERVDAARKHRSRLAGCRMLTGLRRTMPASEAKALGIRVLREDASENMALGMAEVPALQSSVVSSPRTFEKMHAEGFQVLLFRQRLDRAFELVDAVEQGKQLGVHLEGPMGAGKTGINLLAYLLCAARRLPVVYLPYAGDWAYSSQFGVDRGDEFFLEQFFRQNADLVIETPALRRIFKAPLMGEPLNSPAATMEELREAVRSRAIPGLAVIIDGREAIEDAVTWAARDVVGATIKEDSKQQQPWVVKGLYFKRNWCDWTAGGSANLACFQVMSCDTARVSGGTKLPESEQHRLRFIEPLSPEDRVALQATPGSPAYIRAPYVRERLFHAFGNSLRMVVRRADLFKLRPGQSEWLTGPLRRSNATNVRNLWLRMWGETDGECREWLKALPASIRDDREVFEEEVMSILRGEKTWDKAPGLYQFGIVSPYARPGSAPGVVRPSSALAGAVLLRTMSEHFRYDKAVPLSTLEGDDSKRIRELTRQILSALDGSKPSYRAWYKYNAPTRRLDGSRGHEIDLRCVYTVPFRDLSEVVSHDDAVMYRPLDPDFPCDAIVMPAASCKGGKIRFLELQMAAVSPLHPERVAKVRKLFEPAGVVAQLLAASPGRKACVVLAYEQPLTRDFSLPDEVVLLSNGQLPTAPAAGASSPSSSSPSSSPSVAAGRRVGSVVRVIDRDDLPQVGVRLKPF